MFEYHGWITLVASDWDEPGQEEEDRRERLLADTARTGFEQFREQIPNLSLATDSGGRPTFIHMHGCLKHGGPRVFEELYEWAAENLQVSYGLLHFWNDETIDDGDRFFVLRLAAGRVTTHEDELLSPTFDVIDLSRPLD